MSLKTDEARDRMSLFSLPQLTPDNSRTSTVAEVEIVEVTDPPDALDIILALAIDLHCNQMRLKLRGQSCRIQDTISLPRRRATLRSPPRASMISATPGPVCQDRECSGDLRGTAGPSYRSTRASEPS